VRLRALLLAPNINLVHKRNVSDSSSMSSPDHSDELNSLVSENSENCTLAMSEISENCVGRERKFRKLSQIVLTELIANVR